MTIPGRGDLAPPHRQTPLMRVLLTALVVVLLGAGGYFAFLGLSGNSSSGTPPRKLPVCATTPAPGPSSPRRVHLEVLNGTLQSGLAAQVESAFKRRGFHVSKIGNTPKLVGGVATVDYGSGQLLAAQAVADQIRGARLVKAPAAGVSLEIGQRFQSLLSKAQARAARARLVSSEAASRSPSPSPTASPTCRAAAAHS